MEKASKVVAVLVPVIVTIIVLWNRPDFIPLSYVAAIVAAVAAYVAALALFFAVFIPR